MTVVVWAVWSDRIKRRAPFVLCGQLLCLTGFVVNVAAESIGARYFGTFLVVSGGYAAYPAMVAWCVFFPYIPVSLLPFVVSSYRLLRRSVL